jgi:hypothetical protein
MERLKVVLKTYVQDRSLWILYALMLLWFMPLVLLSNLHSGEKSANTAILFMLACSFFTAISFGEHVKRILAAPFSFAIPEHIQLQRNVLFLIGLLMNLVFALACFMLSPGHFTLNVATGFIIFLITIWAVLHVTFNSLVFLSFFVLFMVPPMRAILLSLGDVILRVSTSYMLVCCGMIAIVTWNTLISESIRRKIVASGWDRRNQAAGTAPAPLASRFFERILNRLDYFSTAKYAAALVYSRLAHLLNYKTALIWIPLAFFYAYLPMDPILMISLLGWIFGFMFIVVKTETLLVMIGRQTRVWGEIYFAVISNVVSMIFTGILIILIMAASKVIGRHPNPALLEPVYVCAYLLISGAIYIPVFAFLTNLLQNRFAAMLISWPPMVAVELLCLGFRHLPGLIIVITAIVAASAWWLYSWHLRYHYGHKDIVIK